MSLLAEKYKAKQLTVVAVNVRSGETPEMVREFAREQGLSLKFLQDGGAVAMDYGVRGVPATFFIDATGAIDEQLVGFNPAKLEECIQGILGR